MNEKKARTMKKAILASVAMAAAAAACAQGRVQLYGLADAYVGSMRRSDQAARATVANSNGMTTAYWGVAGTEDLGGGLKARFALESFFQTDTGAMGRNAADPFFSRNAWVGLEGHWGQFSVGRQTNRLFVASGQFDSFGGSLQFSPIMLQTWQATYNRAVLGDSVWNNSLQYASPSFGGFRVNAVYGLGEQTGNHKNNASLTVNYASGPFAAVLAAQRVEYGPGLDGVTPAIDKQNAVLAAASYHFGVAQVYGQIQRTRTPSLNATAHTYQLGTGVPVGPAGKIMASIAATRREAGHASHTRRTTWAVGYDHNLSKRTDVYAIYLNDRLTGYGNAGSVGVGIRHRF